MATTIDSSPRSLFDKNIASLFRTGVRVAARDPFLAFRFLKMLRQQHRAAKLRAEWLKNGVEVPPVLIISLTNKCNLSCKGCYAQIHRAAGGTEMTSAEWASVVKQAEELGTSIIIVAGGEPFLRPELLDLATRNKNTVFPVFTNGLLLDGAMIDRLSKVPNLIPVLSMEGLQKETDDRRGAGVFEGVTTIAHSLRRKKVFFGLSVTVTRENFDLVTSGAFIQSALKSGARLFFFVEYVPVQPGSENLVILPEQKEKLRVLERDLERRFRGVFVAFPGDEERHGGCLAAGRGFVHVNATGGLERCPFAPYADMSLKKTSLKEALQSPFLRTIRENHHRLKETRGGCALWANREWMESIRPSAHDSHGTPGQLLG